MTRRTTSRAPGMFPGRQPSSHPNPCLGGCVPATPGANARFGGPGKYTTTAAKQAAAMGSSPREECLRRHRGWSRNETVRGLSATRRARAAKRDGGCGSHKAPRVPQRAAGMPQPWACHKRREPLPEDRPPAGTTSPRSDRTTRRGIPASAMRRGLRDTPPGGYYKRPLPSRPHDTARFPQAC